jgi:hypothetical protein
MAPLNSQQVIFNRYENALRIQALSSDISNSSFLIFLHAGPDGIDHSPLRGYLPFL